MAGMTPGARRRARVSSLDGKEKSMRKRLVAATAMLLSTTAGAAGTQEKPAPMHFYDGNKLLAMCEAQSDFDRGRCLGFVVAVTDRGMAVITGAPDPGVCLEKNVTDGQVMTIVLKYLRENRDKLHWAAWSLALNALIAVFPCEKADSGPLRSAAHY